jgi:methionyl aminopeptidase
MITVKTPAEIAKMREAGKRLQRIMHEVAAILEPQMSTLAIDAWLEKALKEAELVPQCKGYMGYKHVSCISVNDEVVHGVPRERKIIKEGDLVKIDICAAWQGYCADMARCFFVGNASSQGKKLVEVAKQALEKGIEQAQVGKHLSDISAAIQQEVEKHGFGVVRDFAGHGIGTKMHEEPEILNYGKPGKGPVLKEGMTFAIEPMITQGKYAVYVLRDGWTVKTVDGGLAAHIEDTIAITNDGPVILTR